MAKKEKRARKTRQGRTQPEEPATKRAAPAPARRMTKREEAEQQARMARFNALGRFQGKLPWQMEPWTAAWDKRVQVSSFRNIVALINVPKHSQFDLYIGKGELATFFQPSSDGAEQQQGVLGFFRFGPDVVVVYCEEDRVANDAEARLESSRGRQAVQT